MDTIFVNPKDVNFAQVSTNTTMSDAGGGGGGGGGKVKMSEMVKQVKAANTTKGGNSVMESMKPIRVRNVKGQLVSLDNRRLAIARKGKSKIIAIEMITDLETAKQLSARLKSNGLPNQGTNKIPRCG